MIGKVLGNRYRIVEKIGDGGTAFVYRGLDSLLNRSVTVKVLRPEYASDQDFVRRFRREAQAAASLSHPNVVSIYDVGYEEGIHYIVMEYVKGKSLKELVESEGFLPLETAADYALQTANALAHAHRHGIIHRDVKPHNILINDEGRVKVTDFGIAQATTAATVTYNGAILGSVYYFSPEQASGGQTGEKSDIYSLGMVLYEMITGTVPYQGDSPVSVAIKHIQEPLPDPRVYNSDIPDEFLKILKKAAAKKPEDRYNSAAEMANDLLSWLKEGRLPGENRKVEGIMPQEGTRAKKKKAKALRVLLAVLLLVVAVGIALGIGMLRNLLVVPEVEVPLVEGESLTNAADILRSAGLDYIIKEELPDDTIPAGYVLRQFPQAGRMVKKNRKIELTLSTGPVLVKAEDVVGKTELEATLILKNQGFQVEVRKEYSDQPPSTVIRQDPPAGYNLAKGTTITITVSEGGRPFAMRDLTGISLEAARDYIELFGLELGEVQEIETNEYPPGTVVNQYPEAGTMVQAGDLVDLVVSKAEPAAEQRTIRINTEQIPRGETVTVIIDDYAGRREEVYVNDRDVIITTGWGHGEVEVRWRNRVERIYF